MFTARLVPLSAELVHTACSQLDLCLSLPSSFAPRVHSSKARAENTRVAPPPGRCRVLSRGLSVTALSSLNPDDDFTLMCRSHNLVLSGGGFGAAAALCRRAAGIRGRVIAPSGFLYKKARRLYPVNETTFIDMCTGPWCTPRPPPPLLSPTAWREFETALGREFVYVTGRFHREEGTFKEMVGNFKSRLLEIGFRDSEVHAYGGTGFPDFILNDGRWDRHLEFLHDPESGTGPGALAALGTGFGNRF